MTGGMLSEQAMSQRMPESFCVNCDWVGPVHLMTLDAYGHVCEECEMERALLDGVRGATLKQAVTAVPAAAPAVAILAGAVVFGADLALAPLGACAAALTLLHSLYSLEAYRIQQRLPLEHPLTALQRYEPVGVAAVMAAIGSGSATIHLWGFL
jgi:hypothetical protein